MHPNIYPNSEARQTAEITQAPRAGPRPGPGPGRESTIAVAPLPRQSMSKGLLNPAQRSQLAPRILRRVSQLHVISLTSHLYVRFSYRTSIDTCALPTGPSFLNFKMGLLKSFVTVGTPLASMLVYVFYIGYKKRSRIYRLRQQGVVSLNLLLLLVVD